MDIVVVPCDEGADELSLAELVFVPSFDPLCTGLPLAHSNFTLSCACAAQSPDALITTSRVPATRPAQRDRAGYGKVTLPYTRVKLPQINTHIS